MNATDNTTTTVLDDDEVEQQQLPGLSDQQRRILCLLPIFFTVLSTICSGTIIYLVVASGFKTSYKRVLFGLSVADILYSVAISISPFLIPPDSTDHFWTFGNDRSCSFLGMVSQLCLSVWLYNAMLSYYYLFIIRFNVREVVFARRYEPWMHGIAILYPVITAAIGVSKGMFSRGDVRPRCYINEYPRGCDETKGECRQKMIGLIFSTGWLYFCVLSIAAINLILYCHVRRQLSRGRRASMTPERQTKRLREVAAQAFLYVAAFVVANIWIFILRRMQIGQDDPRRLFPLLLMQGIFGPSVGIFNLCIYLRPRYLKARRDYRHETRLWAIRRALYGESILVSNRNPFMGMAGTTEHPSYLGTKEFTLPQPRPGTKELTLPSRPTAMKQINPEPSPDDDDGPPHNVAVSGQLSSKESIYIEEVSNTLDLDIEVSDASALEQKSSGSINT